jgi:hypothetical protein
MSVSSVATLLDAAVLAGTSATTAFGAPLWRRQAIPAGETWVTRSCEIVGFDRRDSSVSYVSAQFTFTILHHLSDPTVTATYVTGAMRTDQEYLMDTNSYRVAGVREVLDVPELELLSRIGNVMEYSVSVQLSIVP